VGAPLRALLKEAKAEQAAEEAEAEGRELLPPPVSTAKPTRRRNRRPIWAPAPSGGLRTYSQPDGVANWPWVGWGREALNPIVGIVTVGRLFDSTRGFPGEGPPGSNPEPWFLADSSTATLRDRKRRLSDRPDRQLSFEGVPRAKIGLRNRADTKLGRFLQSRNQGAHLCEAAKPDTTPVPREHLPQVQVFHTPREQRDLLNPLPFVSSARSLR
jgi:hypothetical protein